MALLAREGGNILVPRPGFPLFDSLGHYYGLEVRRYR